MTNQIQAARTSESNRNEIAADDHRGRLVSAIPAEERRLELAGMSTALLEGGEGPPAILLHGPGETAAWWMRVIPKMVKTHRVIVPDLPGHGETRTGGKALNENRVLNWLNELIDRTCDTPPLLVGHLLGGSIAARFAIARQDRLSRLVLVNSFGLGKFRPAPGFAFRLIRFMVWPTEKNYDRFLPQCIYDVDELQRQMGEYWEPFLAYNLECAEDPDKKSAMKDLMQEVGTPKIPDEKLSRITIPTTLIWGRHDRANKLKIAKAVHDRFNWPLHVIDETRDDPKLERPGEVIQAIYQFTNEKEYSS